MVVRCKKADMKLKLLINRIIMEFSFFAFHVFLCMDIVVDVVVDIVFNVVFDVVEDNDSVVFLLLLMVHFRSTFH